MSKLLNPLKQKIPMTARIGARRRLQDIGPTLGFALNARRRQDARQDLAGCQNLNDYLGFANRWLGAGAIQILPEIRGALDFVETRQPVRACEIGTDYGGTTFLMSHCLPSLRLLIGVDLYIKNRAQLAALKPQGLRLELLNASSYAPNTVSRVEQLLGGQKLDLLLIDGDHSYEGVLKDFLMYRGFVGEDGLVLFHDIVPDYTTRYGRPSAAYSGGVPRLWQELAVLYPSREFINDPGQDGMGLGVLCYSSAVTLPQTLRDAVQSGS